MTGYEPDFVTRTREAVADPRPGDRFHEMYSYWTVVVDVSTWGITMLHAGGPFNLVPGHVPNNSPKRKRGDPEWVKIEPWQVRAMIEWFPTLEQFQKRICGDLLCDRGIDIRPWPQQREQAEAERVIIALGGGQ